MVFLCGFGNVNSFRGICYFDYCLDCSRARDEKLFSQYKSLGKLLTHPSLKPTFCSHSRVGKGNLATAQTDAYKPPPPLPTPLPTNHRPIYK